MIEIAIDIIAQTPKAILVNNGHKEAWIPLSQIDDYTDEIKIGASITIFISEWLAEKKELI